MGQLGAGHPPLSSSSLLAFPRHLFRWRVWTSWWHGDLMPAELLMLQVRTPERVCQWARWRLNLLYGLVLNVIKQYFSQTWLVKRLSSLFCFKCMGYKPNLSIEKVWKTHCQKILWFDHLGKEQFFIVMFPNLRGLLTICLSYFFHWGVTLRSHANLFFTRL